MKSFVAYPQEFQTVSLPQKSPENTSRKVIAYCELYKKVIHLNGSIVKCGVTAAEDLTNFAEFVQGKEDSLRHKIIAFEKHQGASDPTFNNNEQQNLKTKEKELSSFNNIYSTIVQQGVSKIIEFIPGSIIEVLPEYIIINPELKLSMLTIDLDDYDATLTTLEFLFPRLMPGGILILDNFYKCLSEACAVKDYFSRSKVLLNKFSLNSGPHYILKA